MKKLNLDLYKLTHDERNDLICDSIVGSLEIVGNHYTSFIEIVKYKGEIGYLDHESWPDILNGFNCFMSFHDLYESYEWNANELLCQLDDYNLTGPKTHENTTIITIVRLLAMKLAHK